MSYFVTSDRRILSDKNCIEKQVEYIEVQKYPCTIIENGKYKIVCGVKNGKIQYRYEDIDNCSGVQTTELDRIKNIEEAVLKSNEELRQEGYDNCIMDMVKEGVI